MIYTLVKDNITLRRKNDLGALPRKSVHLLLFGAVVVDSHGPVIVHVQTRHARGEREHRDEDETEHLRYVVQHAGEGEL